MTKFTCLSKPLALLACALTVESAGRAQEYRPSVVSDVTKKRVLGPPFQLSMIKDKLEFGKVENDFVGMSSDNRRVYTFALARRDGVKPTEAIQIDAASSEFDTFLSLYENGSSTAILTDDNSGGGRNARLVVPPSLLEKPFVVVVSSKYPDDIGRFTLAAAAVAYTPPERPTSLPMGGQPVNAAFTDTSLRKVGSDVPLARYSLNGVKGQRFEIDVKSSEIDPEIELDLNAAVLSRDRDSGDGTDARFVRTFKRDGEHTLTVYAADRGLGRYVVSAKGLPTPPIFDSSQIKPLLVGQSITASFDANSLSEDDHAFAIYELFGGSGQTVEVSIEAKDAQLRGRQPVTFVDLGVMTDIGWSSRVRWGRRNPSSNVDVSLPKSGKVLVRAAGSLDFLGAYVVTAKLAASQAAVESDQ